MGTTTLTYTAHDEERYHPEDPRPNDVRSAFERDRSRIIHSAAFRRLQGKTQVFTAGEGDFFRTRLTHSLEVAQIAKGLALKLEADTDLVESIALVHDIGHPPFGHAGENELKRLLKRYGGFEANAQNLRILTQLENKSNSYYGLNLTRAVIDGQLKYKNAFTPEAKKFIYREDLPLVDWASREAQSAFGLGNECKSFECEIMDWADEIAYAVHDLEDSIHARYIDAFSFNDNNPRTVRAIHAAFKSREVFQVCNSIHDVFQIYEGLRRVLLNGNPGLSPNNSTHDARRSKSSRKQLTGSLIHRYIQASRAVERRIAVSDPISNRYQHAVHVEEECKVEVKIINELIREFVLFSPQVRTLEEKGKHIIRSIFLKFMRHDNARHLLPDDWKGYIEDGCSQEKRARVVCDYICGMTDDYAQKTYARLFLPNQGSIYDVF